MDTLVELRSAQKELDTLFAKKDLTAAEQKRTDILLSKVASLRDHAARVERAANAAKQAGVPVNSAETRAANLDAAFRKYLRSGDAAELRTYAPMSTSGVTIPEGFAAKYVEQLKSFSGIRAVANIISTATGQSLKNPTANDTSNTGERLNESDPVSLANPTFNKVTFGAYRYSSKGVQYSAQLLADAGIPVEDYLSKIFARRIGKIQNSEYTVGGSGAMSGVIPSITSVLTSASPTAVTVGEIVDLQNIDEAYLSGAVYMFNPATERALRKMTGSDGLPVFSEMRTARVICGYPYVLNVSMADIAASAKAIAFGNFQHAVTVREVTPQLLISRERFAEVNQMYAALRADADCQVVDASSLTVLQQHS